MTTPDTTLRRPNRRVRLRLLAACSPWGGLAARHASYGGALDVCGEVLAVDDGVEHLAVGDQACGTVLWPSNAKNDHALLGPNAAPVIFARATFLARRPSHLTPVEAAAVPTQGATALRAFSHARLLAGEHLLVADAASPLGALAVQLGRALGVRVTALCRDRDVPLALDLGAHAAVATDRTGPNPRAAASGAPGPTWLAASPPVDVVVAGLAALEGGWPPGARYAVFVPMARPSAAILGRLWQLVEAHGVVPLVGTPLPPSAFPEGLRMADARRTLPVVSFDSCPP